MEHLPLGKPIDQIPPFLPVLTAADIYNAETRPDAKLLTVDQLRENFADLMLDTDAQFDPESTNPVANKTVTAAIEDLRKNKVHTLGPDPDPRYTAGAYGEKVLCVKKADSNVWIAATETGLFRSVTGGFTWTRVWDKACASCFYVGDSVWLAGGYAYGLDSHPDGWGIMRSTDNGETWERCELTVAGVTGPSPWAFATDGNIIVAGLTQKKGALWSGDRGRTWSKCELESPTGIGEAETAFLGLTYSEGLWLAGGGNSGVSLGGIWASTDGKFWSQREDTLLNGAKVYDIRRFTTRTGAHATFACVYYTDNYRKGGVFRLNAAADDEAKRVSDDEHYYSLVEYDGDLYTVSLFGQVKRLAADGFSFELIATLPNQAKGYALEIKDGRMVIGSYESGVFTSQYPRAFGSVDEVIELGAAVIDELKNASVYVFKGSVATVDDLPEAAEVGDVFNVATDGMNYAWDGERWDALGATVDLSDVYQKIKDEETRATGVETTIYNAQAQEVVARIQGDSALQNTKQDKLVAGESITIAADGKTVGVTPNTFVKLGALNDMGGSLDAAIRLINRNYNGNDHYPVFRLNSQARVDRWFSDVYYDAIEFTGTPGNKTRLGFARGTSDTIVRKEEMDAALAAKQAALTAGTNITIAGNVISATVPDITVDTSLSKDSANPIQNQWLGKRMGATSSNSVQIGYNAKAGATSGATIIGGDDGNQVAVGHSANGSNGGAAVGYCAYGYIYGVAVGRAAGGSTYGAAVGYNASGNTYGAAVGSGAYGYTFGAAVGADANGTNYGAAVGRKAKTNSAQGAVAVGYEASADSDTPIVIGGSQFASTAQITVSKEGVLKVGGNEIAKASDIPDTSGFALKSEIPDTSGFALKSEIPDTSGFALKSEIPDTSGFALKSEIPDTSGFALKSDVDAAIGDINSILETL